MAAYEVLLLNTAIPQIQAAQSGDTYVVPRDIAFSAALTLSAGTANGVPYLNASKVLTSGSALTFDGTNLSNTGRFIVNNVGSAAGITDISFGSLSGGAWINTPSANTGYLAAGGSGAYTWAPTLHTWSISNSEQMRLTSTGLGIGTSSPANPLNIVKDNTAFRGQLSLQTSTAANFAQMTFYDQTTLAAQIYQGYTGVSGVGNLNIVNVGVADIAFWTTNTERARITSDGNLLVGTASVLQANRKLQVTDGGVGIPALFKQTNSSANECLDLWNSATSGNNVFVEFQTDAGVARGTISYNRTAGLVAYNTTSDYRAKDVFGPVTNTGATIDALKVYNGKMKDATQSRPMLIAHEAQEVTPYAVTGEKDAVDEDGKPKYQQMDVSSLVPLLIAEIQSLRARVAQLEQGA